MCSDFRCNGNPTQKSCWVYKIWKQQYKNITLLSASLSSWPQSDVSRRSQLYLPERITVETVLNVDLITSAQIFFPTNTVFKNREVNINIFVNDVFFHPHKANCLKDKKKNKNGQESKSLMYNPSNRKSTSKSYFIHPRLVCSRQLRYSQAPQVLVLGSMCW